MPDLDLAALRQVADGADPAIVMRPEIVKALLDRLEVAEARLVVDGVMLARGAEAFERQWDAMIEAGLGEKLNQSLFIRAAVNAALRAALGGDEHA